MNITFLIIYLFISMFFFVCLFFFVFFFFFQAEDGIRDYKVTGVQTCALPIWRGASSAMTRREVLRLGAAAAAGAAAGPLGASPAQAAAADWQRYKGTTLFLDRKSGVEGKRVDLGGRRIIKKKKKET